jgi:hypothetical protein
VAATRAAHAARSSDLPWDPFNCTIICQIFPSA